MPAQFFLQMEIQDLLHEQAELQLATPVPLQRLQTVRDWIEERSEALENQQDILEQLQQVFWACSHEGMQPGFLCNVGIRQQLQQVCWAVAQ